MPTTKPALNNILQHPAIWRAADALRAMECRAQGRNGVTTGFAALDKALPDGGWPEDGLAEVLCPHWGCGEAELLASLLSRQSAQSRWLVWVNPPWVPYAPTLARQGIVLENTLMLQCRNDRDALWAMEQCLASGSCSVVQGWPLNPQPPQLRRLQLAAQKGHGLALLLRPLQCGQQPSPAPLRLELGPLQQQLQVRILKCRGQWGTDWLYLKPQASPTGDNPVPLPVGSTSIRATLPATPPAALLIQPALPASAALPGSPAGN